MTCKKCGRTAAEGGGHWIGCEALKRGTQSPAVPLKESPEAPPGGCEHEGCEQPKYSSHQSVKYCQTHRDPKNRK